MAQATTAELRELVTRLGPLDPDLRELMSRPLFRALTEELGEDPARVAPRLRELLQSYLHFRLARERGEPLDGCTTRLEAREHELDPDHRLDLPPFLRSLAELYVTESELISAVTQFEEPVYQDADHRREEVPGVTRDPQQALCAAA